MPNPARVTQALRVYWKPAQRRTVVKEGKLREAEFLQNNLHRQTSRTDLRT